MICKGKGTYVDSNGHEIRMKGNFEIPNMDLRRLTCKGKIEFNEINADNVWLKGRIEGKNIFGSEIYLYGKANLHKITGDCLKFELCQQNEIDQIECKKLVVQVEEHSEDNVEFIEQLFNINLKKYIHIQETKIHIGKIVAEDLELNGCNVKEVICKNIKARNCTIGKIECTGRCDVL